jgi:hypothetical protein
MKLWLVLNFLAGAPVTVLVDSPVCLTVVESVRGGETVNIEFDDSGHSARVVSAECLPPCDDACV